MDKETLDKQQVATIFEQLRLRAPRPAWTGSPDRNPSEIPPVEIPQAIRDRAKANGTKPESESGAILTPPGSGGDVHGGASGPGPVGSGPPALSPGPRPTPKAPPHGRPRG